MDTHDWIRICALGCGGDGDLNLRWQAALPLSNMPGSCQRPAHVARELVKS